MKEPVPYSAIHVSNHIPYSSITSSKTDFHTNYVLVCKTGQPVFSDMISYLVKFFDVLHRHMSTEYEVQVKNGMITPDGKEMLRRLNDDHQLFQYKPKLVSLLSPWINLLLAQPLQGRHRG